MPKIKVNDLRTKEDAELLHEERGCRKELFDLRFKPLVDENPNPSRIWKTRKQIARIQTILRERQLKIRGQEPR